MTTTIEVNDQAVRAALGELQRRVNRLQPVLQAVGEDITQRAKARFGTSTGPDGVRWKANAPAVAKAKGGRPPLVGESGDLRRQIVPQVAGDTLTVTSTPVYAAIQQFGGTIERAAYSKQVRHRTDAKGNLLRSEIMGGRGLIFAKDSHKRVSTRWFEVAAHKITIPARPFMPVRSDGSLYPAEQAEILAQINAWLTGPAGGGGLG